MKKTIYVTIASRVGGDSFDLIATYDKDEAVRVMEADESHLTPDEKEKYEYYIESQQVDVLDGESAEEAYRRLLIEDEWYE